MTTYTNSENLYIEIKSILQKKNYIINPFRDILYGIQFLIFKNNQSELLKIYEGKKGLKIDFFPL